MRTFLHRLLGFTPARGFDAAGGGRRWEGARTVDGLNAAILVGATTAARRGGWYARNNPWVAAAVDSLVGNVVGAGIKPRCIRPERMSSESQRHSSNGRSFKSCAAKVCFPPDLHERNRRHAPGRMSLVG